MVRLFHRNYVFSTPASSNSYSWGQLISSRQLTQNKITTLNWKCHFPASPPKKRIYKKISLGTGIPFPQNSFSTFTDHCTSHFLSIQSAFLYGRYLSWYPAIILLPLEPIFTRWQEIKAPLGRTEMYSMPVTSQMHQPYPNYVPRVFCTGAKKK